MASAANSEKWLTATTAAAFIIAVALAVIIVKRNNRQEVCVTAGCIHAASHVLDNMDPSVDPCVDFYQFACGNFERKQNIPDDDWKLDHFSIVSDKVLKQLRSILEEPLHHDDMRSFQLVKKLYQACMNKEHIEEEGIKTLLLVLKDLGGWPILEGDKWNDSHFDWKESVLKFRKVGFDINHFISLSVDTDYKNSTKRIIYINQANLELSREFLINGLEDNLVTAYYDYMIDIAVLFGANKEQASEELKDSLKFEMSLANISLPREEERNFTALYNPMTVDDLQKRFPSILWLDYINNILSPHTSIDSKDVIVIKVPKYISDFEKLIRTTPKRVQANYVMWRAVASCVPYLSENVRKRELEYSTSLTGNTEMSPRWKECAQITTESLPLASGALYVRKYFNENIRQKATELVIDVLNEFKLILKEVEWMDDETKKNALDKAALMQSNIAYPDELLDDRTLIEFYSELEINENHYLKSLLNVTLFGKDYIFKQFRLPVNKTDWVLHGQTTDVNAYYDFNENSIELPAGILQDVFFSADRPRYMNYGSMGFLIGHEITHGFDDQGRQFDKDGNLVDWWQPATMQAYMQKAQCIIDQYGNYSVPELNLKLNGITTQGENIADNGGIKEAYLAYNSWVKRNNIREPQLAGLDYTPNQMFWISAANIWCTKSRPESVKLEIMTGVHSLQPFRVIGSFSNSEHFVKDFNCPMGAQMDRIKKCKVW